MKNIAKASGRIRTSSQRTAFVTRVAVCCDMTAASCDHCCRVSRGHHLGSSLRIAKTDVLGFAIDREHERDGKLMAVSLRAGSVRILLGRDDGAKGWDRVKGEGFSLQITTDQDIDEFAQRIEDAGGTLDSDPIDTPWGARIFRLRDPDGFKYTISSQR